MIRPTRRAPTKKNNQAWLLYSSIGLFLLLVCGGIFVIVREVTHFADQVINSDEFQSMQAAMADATKYENVPEDAKREGVVAPGERKPEYVDTFIDDVWTFQGHAGQTVTVRLEARDAKLDPQLYLYHPDGYLIAENDDIYPGVDTNAEIYALLPEDGRYSIVVSAFGEGGAYELFLD